MEKLVFLISMFSAYSCFVEFGTTLPLTGTRNSRLEIRNSTAAGHSAVLSPIAVPNNISFWKGTNSSAPSSNLSIVHVSRYDANLSSAGFYKALFILCGLGIVIYALSGCDDCFGPALIWSFLRWIGNGVYRLIRNRVEVHEFDP